MSKILFRSNPLVIIALAVGIVLTSCDTVSLPGITEAEEQAAYGDRSVAALYNSAMDKLETGWHQSATELFDELHLIAVYLISSATRPRGGIGNSCAYLVASLSPLLLLSLIHI